MMLNEDIFRYLVPLLPLEDVISLTQVSKELRAWAENEHLWIQLLTIASEARPLPCTDDFDLSKLPLAELKHLAFYMVKREHNWSSETTIIEPRRYTRFHLGRSHSIISSIPGTSLLVLHSVQDGTAVCYDTELARHQVYIGHSIFHVSPAVRHNKMYLIALLAAEDVAENHVNRVSFLLVLTVQDDGKLDIRFQRSLAPGFTYGQLFLNPHVVGLLRVFEAEALNIVAFNLNNGACRVVRTDTMYDSQMGAWLDHDLYIVKDRSATSSNVHHCPARLLPYDDTHEGVVHTEETLEWDDHGIRFWDGIDASIAEDDTWFEALGAVTTAPVRGAALATLHHINVDQESSSRVINIRFWGHTGQSRRPVSRRLAPLYTFNLMGMLATGNSLPRHPYLVAYSDVSMLLVVEYQQSRSIRLIRYNPWTSHSTFHLLNPPPEVNLAAISGIALDDHRGIVALVDQTNVLYSISYV